MVTLLTALATLGWSEVARSQAEPETATPAATPTAASSTSPPAGRAEATCRPACREGFYCQAGRCLSQCNPACPSDQVCVEGRRCEFVASRGAPETVYEPPRPPPRVAKPFDEQPFSMLAFHWGFSGKLEQSGIERSLDSTLGVNLRADFPIASYVLIGPMFQFGAWHPEGAPSHNYYIDVDLFLRGRIPIDLGDQRVQIWGGIPIGLGAGLLGSSNVPGVADSGWGWNVGGMVGAAVHWRSGFGLFTELGWLQHRLSHERQGGGGQLDYRVAQWILNVGIALKN